MASDDQLEGDGRPAGWPDPLDEVIHDVEFVVPAAAYDSIDTDDELARDLGPERVAPADRGAPDSRAIEALRESIHRRLDALQTLFEREIRAEATREKVVDRLHAELQE